MSRIVQFQRGLKSRHVSLIALGGIIGSSYFLGTGYILNQVGPFVFLAYALGGLITYLTMACLTELCVAIPGTGSFISYARHFVSPTWACGVGWSYWVSWVVYIPSECLAAGILMHNFMPHIPIYVWAVLFGIVITLVNLINVKAFGEMEFWLALIKICLLIGFSVLAVLIFFDFIGNQRDVFIGDKYLMNNGNPFPNGFAIFFINMVVLLSNYQGSEIIGLSASEAQNPKKAIPAALKKIVYRIVGFYLIPTFLLALIFPWEKANLAGSVFSDALASYGLTRVAQAFSFLIIAGALSCANSGLYATVRSLHALATKEMAPKWLAELNKQGVPVKATLVTLAAIWMMLIISYFFSAHSLYANLLAISGFTGSICWISICWSQLRFRHSLTEKIKTYKIPFFPYLTHFAIWLQIGCLLIVALSPELRDSLYFGVPMLILPMLLYHHFIARRKSIR